MRSRLVLTDGERWRLRLLLLFQPRRSGCAEPDVDLRYGQLKYPRCLATELRTDQWMCRLVVPRARTSAQSASRRIHT
jgi:hypothetical protein